MPHSISRSSGSSMSSEFDFETVEDRFILRSRATSLFFVFTLSCAVFVSAGIIRSAVLISNVGDNFNKLATAKEHIVRLAVIEQMIDLVYKESFARIKYLSSGLSPTYYTEMTTAVNEIDALFATKTRTFQNVFFRVAEYVNYNCSLPAIRSNLEQRANAVLLTNHRQLDERGLDHFYECLLNQLADFLGQLVSKADGIERLWQQLVGYFLSVKSVVIVEVAMNHAHLTREMTLKKGSVTFATKEEVSLIEDMLELARLFISRAASILPVAHNVVYAAQPAVTALNNILSQMEAIDNATKVLIIVAKDKFEPSSLAKVALGFIYQAKEQFRTDLAQAHAELVDLTNGSFIAEAVKLFIFIVILPPLIWRNVIHMRNESNRLQTRYAKSVNRYQDSSKAVFRLLPEQVAKKLNSGKQVLPEYFHNVTVFYSDIVGFTAICSKLTATEVLALLNQLYATFDSRTGSYKCFKIETIGDAYVVASGVPKRTSTHASEMASLALVLVEEVGGIKMPHNNQPIRIRVGMNSGPVIAGIIGAKMLRYCLFGNTVLYANRMEQTSEAQRIQVSQSCFFELQRIGGFLLNLRAEWEWPDGLPTYWLVGQTTTSAPLSLLGSPEVSTINAEVNRAG